LLGSACFRIIIWRRMSIDLVKVWLIYREEKGLRNAEIGDHIDALLNFVLGCIREELEAKIREEILKRFGRGFLDALLGLQKRFIEEGNYDSELEPILGYMYIWRELFSGIVLDPPPEFITVVTKDKNFKEKGVFGSFLRKSLVSASHTKYPLTMFFGVEVRKCSDIC